MKTEIVELSKSLKKSLADAEQMLTRCSEIRQLVLSGEARLLQLTAQKVSLESDAAASDAAVALGEGTSSTASKLRDQISAAEAECRQLSGTVPVYRQRLIDQHSALTDCQANVSSGRDFYAEKVAEAYAVEYRAVAEAYAAVVEKGRLLAAALRVDIPTPPMPAAPRVEVGPAASRIGDTLAAIDDILRDIERSKQWTLRDSLRRKPLNLHPDTVYEFLRRSAVGGQVYETGTRIFARSLPALNLERLYATRSVKVL